MRITFFAVLLLLVRCAFGVPAPAAPSCSASLQFHGSSSASHGGRDYSFTFLNRFSHAVYFLAYRRDVPDYAGQPFHYERFRRWGCWSPSQYQFRDVRMVFRRVRQGETLSFRISRERSFWPWRASVVFYAKPDYNAVSEEVFSDTITQ